MLLELQQTIIYGPVRSRRLGRSLGINVLPARRKVCSFNCVYCQYGWEESVGRADIEASTFPAVEEIERAVKAALAGIDPPPAYVTFSGNGEASLHPDFTDLVERITHLRDRLAPAAQTAILSNSSTASDPEVRQALSRLDVRIMKLDVGCPQDLTAYNRPAATVELETILDGLTSLKDVTIQTLFSTGPMGNCHPQNITPWIACLKKISPKLVQIYTLDRPSPAEAICRVPKEELLSLQERLHQEHIRADVF